MAQDLPPATFQSKVNIVLVPVVVRDAKGRAVGNLSKDDFQLFDKGKRQTISSFSILRQTSRFPDNGDAATTPAGHPERATVAASGSNRQISRIYLFDDLNTEFADLAASRDAALRHFQNDLPATDRAAIYAVSGNPTQDFTSDRAKLLQAIGKVGVRLSFLHSQLSCLRLNYYLADLMMNTADQQAFQTAITYTIICAHVRKDQAEAIVRSTAERELVLGVLNTRIVLGALRRAIRRLAEMPGQRMIVLASPGFYAQTPEGSRGMAEILDLAARANVTISGLDPHGVDPPDSDASQGEPYLPWQRYRRESLQADNDAIIDLTGGTGGTFFRHNNDLTKGFAQAAAPPEFSYMLGFSPRSLKSDGSFHTLKIRLPNQKGIQVEARHGYFAQTKDSRERGERTEIDDAVFSRDEVGNIPVVLQTGYSKPNDSDDAKVLIVAKVDLAPLHYEKEDGRNHDSLTAVSALFDADGGYVTGTATTVNLNLRDETMQHPDASVTLRSEFNVKQGSYLFRLVIREVGGKAITTLNRTVTIR